MGGLKVLEYFRDPVHWMHQAVRRMAVVAGLILPLVRVRRGTAPGLQTMFATWKIGVATRVVGRPCTALLTEEWINGLYRLLRYGYWTRSCAVRPI